MASIAIGRLSEGDASALLRFYGELSAESLRTFHPLGEETTIETCERIISDNGAGGKLDLVAKDGTRIVGWSFLWGLDTEEPLFGLGVADDHRGEGLGAQLMDAVLAEARGMGVQRIVLTVVRNNERAWAMYKRRGFVVCEAFTGEDGLPYYRMRLAM